MSQDHSENWDLNLEDFEESTRRPTEKFYHWPETKTKSEPSTPRLRSDSRVTQSAPSTPTILRKIDQCFGRFDGVTYDMSGLSPVQAFAKISAVKMITTTRLGLEDATMIEAAPLLSEINRKGILTTDSQMGKKERQNYRVKRRGRVSQKVTALWQRAYVTGFIPAHLADDFRERMGLEDGVLVLVNDPHEVDGMREQESLSTPVPVTLDHDRFYTNITAYSSGTFTEDLLNVLPEVKSIVSDIKCRELLRNDARCVRVVDMTWGRPLWLFEKISNVLDVVNDERARRPLPPAQTSSEIVVHEDEIYGL